MTLTVASRSRKAGFLEMPSSPFYVMRLYVDPVLRPLVDPVLCPLVDPVLRPLVELVLCPLVDPHRLH